MMNAVVKFEDRAPQRAAPAVSFEHQVRLADSFAASGLFGIKTADQALALMALCEAEGMHPAVAVRDYHIIQGKPALKSDAMLARFQANGGKVRWIDMSDERVSGEFSHPAGGTVVIDWDKARATVAGFWGKDNWKKFPRAMLRARTISEGVRTVFPGVISGLYTPEELEDAPASEPTPEPRQQQQRPSKLDYADDQFNNSLPAWTGLIKSGKKTAAQIIATVESKFVMSAQQKDVLHALHSPEDAE